jgi:hypothetical protein
MFADLGTELLGLTCLLGGLALEAGRRAESRVGFEVVELGAE